MKKTRLILASILILTGGFCSAQDYDGFEEYDGYGGDGYEEYDDIEYGPETLAVDAYRWTAKINNSNFDNVTLQLAYAFSTEHEVLVGELKMSGKNFPEQYYKAYGYMVDNTTLKIQFVSTDYDEPTDACFSFSGRFTSKGIEGQFIDNSAFSDKESEILFKQDKSNAKYDMDRVPGAYCSPFDDEYIHFITAYEAEAGIYQLTVDRQRHSIDIWRNFDDMSQYRFTLEAYGKTGRQTMIESDWVSVYGAGCYEMIHELRFNGQPMSILVRYFNEFVIVRVLSGGAALTPGNFVEGIYIAIPSVG